MTRNIVLPLLIAPAAVATALYFLGTAHADVNPSSDTTAEIASKDAVFAELDTDDDGVLSRDEAEALPSVDAGVYGADDFARIDTDSNGEIDPQELGVYFNTDDSEYDIFNGIEEEDSDSLESDDTEDDRDPS